MRDINTVFLMGNLTRDPELRYTPNGQAVANFAIATNRRWNDSSGEQQSAVEYTDIVVWGKMAENVSNYMKKGRRIHVTGRLQTRSWEAQDGSKRSKTEVVASDVIFLDRAGARPENPEGVDQIPEDDVNQDKDDKKKSPAKKEDSKKKKAEEKVEEVDIEDIPF
jgi:single-strand DNA-binding protein